MRIKTKYLYIRLNEWHHLYLGLILTLIFTILHQSYESTYTEVGIVISITISIDDIIQHIIQGIYLQRLSDNNRWFLLNEDHPVYLGTSEPIIIGRRVEILDYLGRKKTFYLPSFLIHTLLYHPRYLNIGNIKWVKNITKLIDTLFGAKK